MQKKPHKKYNLLLFDLDGTLLDTAREFHIALNRILEKEKKPSQSFENVRERVSDGVGAMVSLGFGIDENNFDFEKKKEMLYEAYSEVYLNSEPFDGVEEIIKIFIDKKINWGIVTNKPKIFSAQIFKKLEWNKKANILVCPDDVNGIRKPDPASLIFALKSLKTEAKNTIYVGDNWRDIEAAKSSKITPIFAEYGYVKEINFPPNDEGFNIKNINEVLSFI